MGDYETTGDLNEAVHLEKMDADRLQAQYEAEGEAFWAAVRGSEALAAEGKLDEAAAICPHGGGYPLDSPAAEYSGDPRKGQEGNRCGDCNSVLDQWPYEGPVTVIYPCEPAWEVAG